MGQQKTSFVYVSYIRSTPQKVFEAITTPEVARRYWGTRTRPPGNPGRTGSTCVPMRSARCSWSARWSRSCRHRGWC